MQLSCDPRRPSNEERNDAVIGRVNLLSREHRERNIEQATPGNAEIARRDLYRENGRLFLDLEKALTSL